MSRLLKNSVAFVLLLIFLFPTAERGLHGYSHKDDAHCTATSEKHFHTQEHDCSICDFTITVSDNPIKNSCSFVPQLFYVVSSIGLHTSETLSACLFSFSLRGPPPLS